MESNDLTIIFLTANKVPNGWVEYQKAILLEAAAGLPIITISRERLDWGINIIDKEPAGISNIYWQMLRGAKIALTTYIAIAEDDTLYPKEHFHSFRPPLDAFAYNKNRIGLFTWGKPIYFYKDRHSNATLIAPRRLLIETLNERFEKYPKGTPPKYTGEVGRKNIEDKLGLIHRKCVEFYTEEVSVLRLDHKQGVDKLSRSGRKGLGFVRCYDVPKWGRAEEIRKKFL